MKRILSFLLLVSALMPITAFAGDVTTPKADVNGDGKIDIDDLNIVLNAILDGNQDHEFVDLGLPSGTLWATMNVGAHTPEAYGDYFAWGETAPKENYDWDTYKWSDGDANTLTKYCLHSNQGAVDNKVELDSIDDAACVNWGPEWRMPSEEQIRELLGQCLWQWTAQNGVKGFLVTSRSNGNSMFLPAAGYRWNSLNYAGSFGHYWTRSLGTDKSNEAYFLNFNYLDGRGRGLTDRCRGMCVRAVRAARR